MISDKTVNSFIISHCISGSKFDDNFIVTIFCYYAFDIIEQKDVIGIGEELILSI